MYDEFMGRGKKKVIQTSEEPTPAEISKVMTFLSRKWAKKGGYARAKKMTAEERSESARKASQARWAKAKKAKKAKRK